MAQITINEVSQNYTYSIGTHSYATVALPITACWGPGFFGVSAEYGSDTYTDKVKDMMDRTVWQRFPATQQGLEAFVTTYRGAASIFRRAKDYSYQMALTLLTSGHDVLVCRLCPGSYAEGEVKIDGKSIMIKAKYPGTFGNKLRVEFFKRSTRVLVSGQQQIIYYWNMIVYVVDASGIKTAVENKSFFFDIDNTDYSDTIPYYKEVVSDFVVITKTTVNDAESTGDVKTVYVANLGAEGYNKGSDTDDSFDDVAGYIDSAVKIAQTRYDMYNDYNRPNAPNYVEVIKSLKTSLDDVAHAKAIQYREWLFTHVIGVNKDIGGVLDLLKDKLAYNPQRIIMPGWDDQDTLYLLDIDDPLELTDTQSVNVISPLHLKLMDVAYYSRCATGMLDIPRSLPRRAVYDDSVTNPGYAQKLSRIAIVADDANSGFYVTHSGLFAPWGQLTYVSMSKQVIAPPSMIAILIQRAQILNQAAQYEWALPTNRKHNLSIGKMDYIVPKKLLDQWQKTEGVGVNIITTIPDLGTNLWGNSTLFEVPPATYQALANLSTRYLVNAVEDVVYRVGLTITFQYNIGQAYSTFYAGVTPILDTMRNLGAIDGYYVKMSADIKAEDYVNANTVVGKIWLVINGVINDINVDLICLPQGSDLTQYMS